MRKCFLHIGTHKTGTTSIQLMLSREQTALNDAGYLYPMTGRVGMPYHMIPSILASESTSIPGGHHNIAWRLLGDSRYRTEFGTPTDLYREIETGGDHVILSSEDFLYVALMHLGEFKAFVESLQAIGMTVSVIVYLRNQVDYARSIYVENIKHKRTWSFDDFFDFAFKNVADGMFDYDRILSNLETMRGIEITLRPYDRVAKDVITDFNAVIGFSPKDSEIYSGLRTNNELPATDSFTLFYENRIERSCGLDRPAARKGGSWRLVGPIP